MGTEYITNPAVSEDKFLKVCEKHGIKRADHNEATDEYYPITNGADYLWVTVNNGYISLSRWGRNSAEFVYEIEEDLEACIVSEHDEAFMDLLETQGIDRGYVIITMDELKDMM